MALTSTMKTAILNLFFNNTNIDYIGDTTGLRGSSTAGVFWISLHTADPVAGNQATSEANYTGYARKSVARSALGFTTSGANCSNTAAITFGACTDGSSTVTYCAIGSDETGNGHLFMTGALSAQLAITAGVTPDFAIGELDFNIT